MREIKFRAWDGYNIRYDVTGTEHGQDNDVGGVFLDGEYFALSDNSLRPKAELMQYTGLKDKNGKEIYEGDRVRVLYSDWPSGDYTKMSVDEYKKSISQYGVVMFDNRFGCAEYIVDYEDYKDNIYVGPHGEIEVIGNIYENPQED